MAAGPKRAKRRGASITGTRSASTKAAPPVTQASPRQRHKSQASSTAWVKETSQKPARGGRTATALRGAGRTDALLAAQLEAIVHGLEQVADIRAEMEEMRTIIVELAQYVAALVANSSVQGRDLEPPAPAVTEEVVIVETYKDSDSDDERSEPPGFTQD